MYNANCSLKSDLYIRMVVLNQIFLRQPQTKGGLTWSLRSLDYNDYSDFIFFENVAPLYKSLKMDIIV